MKKILITPPYFISGEIERVRKLLKNDFDILHLRKPEADVSACRQYLHQLSDLTTKTVLHNHHLLYREFDLYGVHFGEHERKENFCAAHIPSQFSISSSFHSLSAIRETEFDFNYGFISPVYDSISKANYPARFNRKSLLKINATSPFPLVALGGVRPKNLTELTTLGFWGAAMLGAIWT